MNLNKFSAAWQHFKIINSLDTIETEEILGLIEQTEIVPTHLERLGIFQHATLIGLLTLFCQSC